MNKQEFLSQLRSGLSGLPQTDIEGHIGFYGEMIDDRIEEGVPEEEAVRQIGTVEEVIEEIIAETPLTKLVKEKVKPKRALKAWEIVLIILGSPVWLPLLIAAAAVILSLYIVLWALIVSLWAVEIALIASVFVSLTAAVMLAVTGEGLTALALLGAGCFCTGLAIFLFFGCRAATRGVVLLAKKIALGVKSLFVGKEKNNEQNS